MLNFLRLSVPCISRNRGVLQIVKIDGKVIKFTASILVRELLVNFEGFGVKSSRKSSKLLPLNCELQLGKIYYLFPCEDSDKTKNQQASVPMTEQNSAVKRIKVVITKKQLQELLSKKTSVEKIIFGIDKACLSDSGASWKPSLVSIPEENELISC